jgi:hypothetical protein
MQKTTQRTNKDKARSMETLKDEDTDKETRGSSHLACFVLFHACFAKRRLNIVCQFSFLSFSLVL